MTDRVGPFKIYVGIDPGPHVGLAVVSVDAEGRIDFLGHNRTPTEFYTALQMLVTVADVLVVEGFVIGGARAASSNETIEMIGAVKYECGLQDHAPPIISPPGQGSVFAGPKWDKLKRIGWHTPGPDHVNSAAGHLLRYLVNNPTLRNQLLPSGTASEEEPHAAG